MSKPHGSKSRAPEICKSVLMVLLTCSAIFLVTRTQIFAGIKSGTAAAPSAATPTPVTNITATTHPLRLAVTQLDQTYVRRYGAQYGDLTEVYASLAPVLSQAFSAAGAPATLTEAGWQRALQSAGIYFDFLGEIPLRTLAYWLTGTQNPLLPEDVSVRRLCLSVQNGTPSLAYQTAGGTYFSCPLAGNLTPMLEAALVTFPANRADFAFHLGAAYDGLDPNTLLLPDPPNPPVYDSANPLGAVDAALLTEPQTAVLQAFSFHPQNGAIYSIPGGATINEGADSLRLYSSGELTYTASDLKAPRFPVVGDPVEFTRALAEATVGKSCGSARLYLSAVTKTETGSQIAFDYALSGAAVQLPQSGHAAHFTIENGILTTAALHFRTYTPSTQTALVLPELQAAAAAGALSKTPGELLLRYEDSASAPLSALWSLN
ncbi:MAG: hypothetical protein RR502_03290 [Oscillospiraceae bacterium]